MSAGNIETRWQLPDDATIPDDFLRAVREVISPERLPNVDRLTELLWCRGWRDLDRLAGQLDPTAYMPASPEAFQDEICWAVERLRQARERGEKVAIWGDFDADGITATSVLWDGLGEFFDRGSQLSYTIPDRLTDSHGLNIHGLERLAAAGVTLVVTCDTGSTNLLEIDAAAELGLDIIVTDHHTLPDARPNVVAIANPRNLDRDHPLHHLSGVAVAYKLVEALYGALPDIPTTPLDGLLDLVAIGLIADLVELKGDCRYLAQRGIAKLQAQSNPETATRPGVAELLKLCKRAGDRPTDISFGLGPRINAVSRIYGDATFCVELLTSHDRDRCRQLALQAENANTRRKALQRSVFEKVRAKLRTVDFSTTRSIVLEDSGWSGGVLGLAAGQIAQEYGRPTILLSRDRDDLECDPTTVKVRGSARSIGGLDLYQLVNSQAHLLDRFGGHPFAAGLSLTLDNLPLFQAAIERELAVQFGDRFPIPQDIAIDLTVTVPELGQDLFRQLKAIEPCGMGNPAPRLLIRRCWFENVRNRNIQDVSGRKVRYIKTYFELWDADRDRQEVGGFPGVWWGHYQDEIPSGLCDAIVELDFNAYSRTYEVRLLDLRSHCDDRPTSRANPTPTVTLLDCRETPDESESAISTIPQLTRCPTNWREFGERLARLHRQNPEASCIALCYARPTPRSPEAVWQNLVGIAKFLSRTGESISLLKLSYVADLSRAALAAGLAALEAAGVRVHRQARQLTFAIDSNKSLAGEAIEPRDLTEALRELDDAIAEQQFHRHYFAEAPIDEICKTLNEITYDTCWRPPPER